MTHSDGDKGGMEVRRTNREREGKKRESERERERKREREKERERDVYTHVTTYLDSPHDLVV